MPVQARLIAGGSLIFIRFHGVQSAAETHAEMSRLRALPGYRPELPEIGDLSQASPSKLRFDAVRRLARFAGEGTGETVAPKRIALYAPSDSAYGMARMFAELSDYDPGHVRAAAFRSEVEALEYVGRTETRFADVPGYLVSEAEEAE